MNTPKESEMVEREPMNYICQVPEHCDRIIWRGQYALLENCFRAPALVLSEKERRALENAPNACMQAAADLAEIQPGSSAIKYWEDCATTLRAIASRGKL